MAAIPIVQITDLHVHADPAARSRGRDTLATLSAVVEAVRAEAPALVLATGDLTDDGDPRAYRRLRPVLERLGRPVAAIPGNHDRVAAMEAHLAGGAISLAPRHVLGGWTIVMLDSTVEGEVGGRLGPDRLAALDRDLAEAGERSVLVVMHHQPAPIGSPLDDVGLDDAEDLYRVLDRRRNARGLLWGHIHHVHESERAGLRLMGSPSTCVQFAADPGADSGVTDEPPAYRRLRLHDDGRIETDVAWVPDALAARP